MTATTFRAGTVVRPVSLPRIDLVGRLSYPPSRPHRKPGLPSVLTMSLREPQHLVGAR